MTRRCGQVTSGTCGSRRRRRWTLPFSSEDGLQRGEQHDHDPREAVPGLGEDQPGTCRFRVEQPRDRGVDQRQGLQQPVENAVVRIEDPRPQERDHHAGQEPGEQEHAPHRSTAADPRVQRQGEGESDQEGEHRRPDGEDQRLPQQLREVLAEHGGEVLQPHELAARVQQALVEERHGDGAQQRIQDHCDQHGQAGKHQQPHESRPPDAAWGPGSLAHELRGRGAHRREAPDGRGGVVKRRADTLSRRMVDSDQGRRRCRHL